MTTTFALLAALLLLPVLVLLWATESRSTRINRLKKTNSVTAIAKRYGVSRSTIRRWAAA